MPTVPNAGAATQAPPAPLVPFSSAAHEHTEPFVDVTVTPATAAQNLGPFDVPAYGFARNIILEITTTTPGALGGGALNADYPFNIFQALSLNDVNGAPIFGPLDGFAALQSNIWGGYAFRGDPRTGPGFSGVITDTRLFLRVPVEIAHHDGFGSLANQNAAASYKLNLTVNTLANLVTGGAPTAPVLRIRAYLEAWSLPDAVDMVGRPQAQFPPVHGTTQFWSQNIRPISVGQNTTPIVRQGNLIRNLVFIARNASGVRVDTVFPDPAQFIWDARVLLTDTQAYRIQVAHERAATNSARDTGVFIYGFNHSEKNQLGDDTPMLWLPTVQATRMELQGNSAVAGTLQIMMNDVAPAEVVPTERYVEQSETGFHPQVGTPTAQA